jgi:predicted transcriptional regulator
MFKTRNNLIKGNLIDTLALDVLDAAKKNGFDGFTHEEIKKVKKPRTFVDSVSLDDKLRIAYKAGKQVAIVVMDEKGMNMQEFSKVFKQPFSNAESNNEAIEMVEEVGIVVICDETVGKHIQRTEMFLNSDLVAVSKVMKKLKTRKVGIENYHFDNKEYELKEIFLAVVVRMFFAADNMDDFLTTMAVSKKEFTIMCILWLSGRPMTNETISTKLVSMAGTKQSDVRSAIRILIGKKHVQSTAKDSSHVHGRKYLFTLSLQGKEVINKFIKRVTEQTMSNLYE